MCGVEAISAFATPEVTETFADTTKTWYALADRR